jgi:hypothetical protein
MIAFVFSPVDMAVALATMRSPECGCFLPPRTFDVDENSAIRARLFLANSGAVASPGLSSGFASARASPPRRTPSDWRTPEETSPGWRSTAAHVRPVRADGAIWLVG